MTRPTRYRNDTDEYYRNEACFPDGSTAITAGSGHAKRNGGELSLAAVFPLLASSF
jgi:hypothetical protein